MESGEAIRNLLAGLAERQSWTTPELERDLQAVIRQVIDGLGGDALRQGLSGAWINEPVRSALARTPAGALTAAVSMDAIAAMLEAAEAAPEVAAQLDTAADAALLLGVLGALGTAATDWTEWSRVEETAPRKIGLAHGAIGLAAISLLIGSAIFRARQSDEPGSDRAIGRILAGVGYLFAAAGRQLPKSRP